MLVPEGAAEHLVAGDTVAEQDPVPGDMGGRAGLLHRFAEHPGLFEIPVGTQPQDVPRGEVGAGTVEFGEHPGVRAGRDDVVAVDERQELRTGVGLTDPGVAGRAEPGVLLPDQPEARVAFRELLRQCRAVVRGAVVDEDDLQVRHGLLGERGQAGTEVLLDVVEGDDDGETGCHRGARSFRGMGLRGAWRARRGPWGTTRAVVTGHPRGSVRVTGGAESGARGRAGDAFEPRTGEGTGLGTTARDAVRIRRTRPRA